MKFPGCTIKGANVNLGKGEIVITIIADNTDQNYQNANYLADHYIGNDSSHVDVVIDPLQPPLFDDFPTKGQSIGEGAKQAEIDALGGTEQDQDAPPAVDPVQDSGQAPAESGDPAAPDLATMVEQSETPAESAPKTKKRHRKGSKGIREDEAEDGDEQ
jgi:hypothetical protein